MRVEQQSVESETHDTVAAHRKTTHKGLWELYRLILYEKDLS